MAKKRFLLKLISLVLCLVPVLSVDGVVAAVLTFETQYDYTKPNIAWLTDIVIKEDMSSAEGMRERVSLAAAPEYPYTETAESFRKDVDYFSSLYLLSPGSAKAAYLMFLDGLNSGSAVLFPGVSDDDIRAYLENAGIVYPENVDSDELIIARTLYSGMVMGSLSGDLFGSGNGLEQVLISYLVHLTGIDRDELKKWTRGTSILSVDEYVLAASKLSLWNSGYDISPETPDSEVYRLSALMTVNQQGITTDADASFDEIKNKYVAAMLGAKYSVSVDSRKLEGCMADGSTAFYILQLIGKKNGLSVRDDNCTYEEAFALVAENTHAFDVEKGEFYADIFDYDVYLSGRLNALWLYPTAYCTNVSGYTVAVSVNGLYVKNNYFSRIELDMSKDVQTLEIKSSCSGKSESSECTYLIRVHQGSGVPEVPSSAAAVPETEQAAYPTSSSLVSEVLASLGLDKLTADILGKSGITLPPGLSNVLPVMAPTFGKVAENGAESVLPAAPEFDDSAFSVLLDRLNAGLSSGIRGIGGVELDDLFDAAGGLAGYVTFG